MLYEYLVLEKGNGIGTLIINRPEAMNALNEDLLKELVKVTDEIAADDDIKVVIIRGAGEKAFVAGADIKFMENLNGVQGRAFGALGQLAFRKIELLEKPVIAAVNGFALGGGCELAMSADIRLASENARFGQPETGLGITPGYGGTQRLARLVGEGRAKELIYTASVINAQEAWRIGLVNHVYPAETLMEEAEKMAMKIMANAPLAVCFSKSAINKGLQTDIDTGMAIEADLFGLCFTTQDQKTGMSAFLRKEKPEYKGE